MDEIRERQSKEYLEEAELTLIAAEAVFKEAKETKKDLWAQVVKACYDSMEQAVSAALAKRGLLIPKEHPAKVTAFANSYLLRDSDVVGTLAKWLGMRSKAQYVDVRAGKIYVPHEIFDEWDAEEAIKDAKSVLDFMRKMLAK
ncbi:HEPN domain-containing protein [archaeon]|nr:MAG: HEPN domain-containing protein [archaeon]